MLPHILFIKRRLSYFWPNLYTIAAVLTLTFCNQAYANTANSSPPDLPGSTYTEPASNKVPKQVCSSAAVAPKASKETEQAILQVAQRELAPFLANIREGKEKAFGFSSRDEMYRAVIGTSPYEVYIRCNGENYPVGRWRVPVMINAQVKGFIGVEWRDGAWVAVEFGGAEFATRVASMTDSLLKGKELEVQEQMHRMLIRDFSEGADSLQFGTYAAQDIKAKSILDVPEIIQEQNQWCWAGVSAALFSYYDSQVEQCEIAEYTRTVASWHDFGSVNCCLNPDEGCNYWNYNWGKPGSIEDILEHMQDRVAIVNYGVGAALTSVELETDLDQGLPPVIRWGWDGGGGHFVVGFGMADNQDNSSDPYVHYMDPWFGEGHHIAYYSWVVQGGSHTWTHTNRLTEVNLHGDVDGSKHLELADIVSALQVVSSEPPPAVSIRADVNGDSRIGLEEAVYLMKREAGL